jgi:predicted esterase
LLQRLADQRGILILAPDSRARDTWDIIRGQYGPDIRFIDRALGFVFERFSIDPQHLAIGGFSDGASYALSVGLMNGELFRHILAFSPGFAAPARATDKIRIFISHGDKDDVLPVERCGRRLARELSRVGYDVDYREFAGGHVVPPAMVDAAMSRFLA